MEYPVPTHRVRAVMPCRRTYKRLQPAPKGFNPAFEFGKGFPAAGVIGVIELSDRFVNVQEHIVEILNYFEHDNEPLLRARFP